MKRSLGLLGAVVALCSAGCADFGDAELEFCLEHLDLCDLDQAPLNAHQPFQAVLTRSQGFTVGQEYLVPETDPVEITARFVLDNDRRRLAYQLSGFAVGELFQVSVGGVCEQRFTSFPLDPSGTGVLDLRTDEYDALFASRLMVATANNPPRAGLIVPRNAELLVAVLSPAEQIPPERGDSSEVEGCVSAVLRPNSNEVDFLAIGHSATLHQGIAGVPSALMATLQQGQVRSMDFSADQALRRQLAYGGYYVVKDGTDEARGQLVRPGDTLYRAYATFGQAGSAGGAPLQAMIVVRGNGVAGGPALEAYQLAEAVGEVSHGAYRSEVGPSTEILNVPEILTLEGSPLEASLRRRTAFFEGSSVRGQFLRPGDALYVSTTHDDATGAEGPSAQVVMSGDLTTYYFEGAASFTLPNPAAIRDAVFATLIEGAQRSNKTFGSTGGLSAALADGLVAESVSLLVQGDAGQTFTGQFQKLE